MKAAVFEVGVADTRSTLNASIGLKPIPLTTARTGTTSNFVDAVSKSLSDVLKIGLDTRRFLRVVDRPHERSQLMKGFFVLGLGIAICHYPATRLQVGDTVFQHHGP